ncbi:MAG: LacI family DNA-binding transcriptional regulator [Pseudomonadota bacterium]|nr:LacI family DNA-binding transcriptional regulator [Pseudomonadota bacterium]
MSRKTTLIQIAEAAGVSLSTVDRVLNRRGGVSPAVEAKVLEWANRLNLDRVSFRNYLKFLRVAVVMQSPQNPFCKSLRDAFTDMNAVVSDMKINCFMHYIDVNNSAATARKISQIAETYDALIVICPDDPQLSDTLRLISKRIPIVTLVTDLPDSGRIAYIGPDNRRAGRAAGELMGRFLGPDGGEILLILGMQRMIGHEEREMGTRSVLRERFPCCTIIDSLESGENQARAAEVVYEALRKNPGVRGIYNVSVGNSAIAKVIRSLGLEHKIILITHELTSEQRQMLREGILDAVIDQNPQLEAQRALEVIGRYFERIEMGIQPEEYIPFNIFIRESCW